MPYRDSFDRLAKQIGNDFSRPSQPLALWSFKCRRCGYSDIKDKSQMACSCGSELVGKLVYKAIMQGSKRIEIINKL